ncbi:MAG: hypothetical protein JJU28_19045 [Cyclobacteriaceae bacterium]|nr:hypothetical protein [Cyclobacteriaceae bacterium]
MKKALVFLWLLTTGFAVVAQSQAEKLTNEATLFYEKNDFSSALIVLKRALEEDQNYEKAYLVRGNIKKRMGDFQGALRDFEKSISLKPDCKEAIIARGDVKYITQDYNGAILDYTTVIDMNTEMLEVYYKRGQAKLMLSAYNEAILDCDKIIEKNPKNIDAYFLRGVIKIEYGLVESGCRDLSTAGEMGDLRAYDELRKHCTNIRY